MTKKRVPAPHFQNPPTCRTARHSFTCPRDPRYHFPAHNHVPATTYLIRLYNENKPGSPLLRFLFKLNLDERSPLRRIEVHRTTAGNSASCLFLFLKAPKWYFPCPLHLAGDMKQNGSWQGLGTQEIISTLWIGQGFWHAKNIMLGVFYDCVVAMSPLSTIC